MTTSTNKISLVTGSSRGLGKNMALALARSGHDLVITYRAKAAEAAATVAEVQALGRKAVALQLDTGVISSFASFTQQLKQALQQTWNRESFDCLVNNAGIDRTAPISDTSETLFDELMNVHFKGVFFLTQTLLPVIADGGSIVNVSTGLARFCVPGYAAYASMKGAVEVLSRYLAKELGARGINVNTIAPGAIETDFTAEALSNPHIKGFIESQTTLGRIGQPDDIGGVVAFLCSEAGRWVNAQRVEASGGMFL
jgi:NAD(P)-dependent dehydrogenase (short-subunit alcohol dehydrogenase family)